MPYADPEKERACQRRWYANNAESQRVRLKRNRTEQIRKNFELLKEYLSSHPCVDCHEPDPVVLDFDHVSGVKKGHVPSMCSEGMSWNTISAEIEKCEVRCANCHRRRTAIQFGWFKKIRGL